MPQVEFDGELHEFPDDFTDADIAAALEAAPVPKKAPGVIAQSRIGPNDRGLIDRALDVVPNRERLSEGVPGVIAGAVKHVARTSRELATSAGRAVESVTGMDLPDLPAPLTDIENRNQWQQLGTRGVQAAETYGTLQAVPGVVAAAKEGGARVLGLSSARAGRNMETALAGAKGRPVNADGAGAQALDLIDDRTAFAEYVPRVVDKFVAQATDPTTPLSPAAAQRFVTKFSRLSANDYQKLTPETQHKIAAIRDALREAIAETTGTDQYIAGVREYRRAKQAAKTWEEVRPRLTSTLQRIGKGAAYATGAGGAGTAIYKGVWD